MNGGGYHWVRAIVFTLLVACCLAGTAAEAQTTEPIAIGAVISLSGRDSAFGQACLSGLQVAIDEVNAEGGVRNRPVALQVYDDRSDPVLAAEGVRVLVRDFHPLAIIGSNTSMVTSAAAVAAQSVGVPLIVPEATNPNISAIGDWIFRVCFVDPDMANALASFSYGRLGLRKVAILMEENHDYTLSLARSFTRKFRDLGGEVVLQMGYAPGETKFADPLRLVGEKEADAVLVSGFYPEAAAILAAARDRKLNIAFLGGDAWEDDAFFSMAGDAITNKSRIYVASHFSPDLQRIKVKGFVAAFEERFSRRPNTSAALGYDACGVAVDAIREAAELTPAAVKLNLAKVHHEGVTGQIDIDTTRSTLKRVIIMQATPDKRFTFLESVGGGDSVDVPPQAGDGARP